MKLLFATGNQNKYKLMQRRLSDMLDIEVIIPKSINVTIEVNEDGKTAEENAIKKALAYYEKTGMPVIAEDSGLYIDNFSEEEQPGLFVKRVNGREDLSDEEILDFYVEKLNASGGESLAHYETGIAVVDEFGEIYSVTVEEEPFLFTSKKNQKETLQGAVLDCISYDIKNKKYFNELTEEEKNERYKKVDNATKQLIKQSIKPKNKVL